MSFDSLAVADALQNGRVRAHVIAARRRKIMWLLMR